MSLIQSINIRKQYQNHLALDDVSFSINEGEIFGLLGPNGAGKTTFIRILNQITAPDIGQILFNGEPLKPQDAELIGYLPEERGLYKKMKVGEQAIYLARLKGLDKQTAITELKKWFDIFNIEYWWNKKVEELSKGMAQKVQFITTVLHHPKLLIFDEPFSGFDPVNVNILKEEILKLRHDGATVIFSTHNMASVEELCDSIVLIDHSKIVLDGKVNEIKRQFCTNKFIFEVELFENNDAANIINSLNINDVNIKDNKLSGTITLDNTSTETLHGANTILSKLITVGNIISFNEILPTMNEIFIKTVSNNA